MRAAGGAARAGAFRLPNTPAAVPGAKSLPPPSSGSSSAPPPLPLSPPALNRAAPPRRRSVARHAQATTMLVELGLAAAAAWMAARPQTDPNRDGSRECAACGGTGKEECACRRWSDDDYGCGTCSGTGWAPCRSCGGGGTAVPIALTARKLAPEDVERLRKEAERDRRERR